MQTTTPSHPNRLLLVLGIGLLAVFMWSAMHPHDRLTWFLEVFPLLFALPILALTYRRFPLTSLLYICITLHGMILLIGGHYTYAEVPLFNWLRDTFHLSRNHFDRVGHFAQGFVPALLTRELLARTSPLQKGKWLFVVSLACALSVSLIYELFEWLVAITTGAAADAFLGTQGDPWDTQKDMAMALIGATVALTFFSRLHDRLLEKTTTSPSSQSSSRSPAARP